MFSSVSYAEWTVVSENKMGKMYLDFERIRKNDGYIYYWLLTDYKKPFEETFSAAMYIEGDCNLFRYKVLTYSFFKEPMGGGVADTQEPVEKH